MSARPADRSGANERAALTALRAASYEDDAATAARYLDSAATFADVPGAVWPRVTLSPEYARAIAAMLEWQAAELHRVNTRFEDEA